MGEFTISSRDVLRSNAANASDPISGRGQLREQVMGAVKQVQQATNAAGPADSIKENSSTASAAQVADQIEQLNKAETIRNTSLQFVMQEDNEPPVVQVVDKDSGDVIRQIPSEVALKIAKAIDELVDNPDSRSGYLFDSSI